MVSFIASAEKANVMKSEKISSVDLKSNQTDEEINEKKKIENYT